MLGANIILNSSENLLSNCDSNGFLVGFCGESDSLEVPRTEEELNEVHKEERILKLLELAKINEQEMNFESGRLLRLLRSQLMTGEVELDRSITHTDMEQWSYGIPLPAGTVKLRN